VGQEAKPILWTFGAKIVPNVLPLLVGLPFWVGAIVLARRGIVADAVEIAAFGLVICAVSLNWLGLFGNDVLREKCIRNLNPAPGSIFVGISRPGFKNALDPHEDIGFLSFEADRLIIQGERIRMEIPRMSDLKFGFAPNPHTVLGLGRWLDLDGGRDFHIHIEPREERSLRANRALGTKMIGRLRKWKQSGG
jgi:hypothetical protein